MDSCQKHAGSSIRLYVKGTFACSAQFVSSTLLNNALKSIGSISLKWRVNVTDAETRFFRNITTLSHRRETCSQGLYYNLYELRTTGCPLGLQKLRTCVNSHVAVVKVGRDQLLLMTDNLITQRLGIKPFLSSDGSRLHCINISRDSSQQRDDQGVLQNTAVQCQSRYGNRKTDPFVGNFSAWPPDSSLLTKEKLSELLLKQFEDCKDSDAKSSCARTDHQYVERKQGKGDKPENRKINCKGGKSERSETEVENGTLPERKRHRSEAAVEMDSPRMNKEQSKVKVKDKTAQKAGKDSILSELKAVLKAKKSEKSRTEHKKSKHSDKQRSTSKSSRSDKPSAVPSKQQKVDQVFSSMFTGLTKEIGRIPKKIRPPSEKQASSAKDTNDEKKKSDENKAEGKKSNLQHEDRKAENAKCKSHKSDKKDKQSSHKSKHKNDKENTKKSNHHKEKSKSKWKSQDLDSHIVSERDNDANILDSVFKGGDSKMMVRDTFSDRSKIIWKSDRAGKLNGEKEIAIPGLGDLNELNAFQNREKMESLRIERNVKVTEDDLKISLSSNSNTEQLSGKKLDIKDLVNLALFGDEIAIPMTEACLQLYECILSLHHCPSLVWNKSVTKEVGQEKKKSTYTVKLFNQDHLLSLGKSPSTKSFNDSERGCYDDVTNKLMSIVQREDSKMWTFPEDQVHTKGADRVLVIPEMTVADLSSDDELLDISRNMDVGKNKISSLCVNSVNKQSGGKSVEREKNVADVCRMVAVDKSNEVTRGIVELPTSRPNTPSDKKRRSVSSDGKDNERSKEKDSKENRRRSRSKERSKDRDGQSQSRHRSRRSQSRERSRRSLSREKSRRSQSRERRRRSRSKERSNLSQSRSRHSDSRERRHSESRDHQRPKTPSSGDKGSGKLSLNKRLEKTAVSTVSSDHDKMTGRTEKRHERQYHPYRKDDRPSRRHIPHWSFDLAYSDMNQLLLNMTENSFKKQRRRPAEVYSRTNSFGRRSNGNRGRFYQFRFRRSEVLRTPPKEICYSSDDENYMVHPDEIPDLKERAKQADVLENFMGSGEDEEYSSEMLIYEKETKEDERLVSRKGERLRSAVVIPGGPKTSTFSGQELHDSSEASEELAFLESGRNSENIDKQTSQLIAIERKDTYTNRLVQLNMEKLKSEVVNSEVKKTELNESGKSKNVLQKPHKKDTEDKPNKNGKREKEKEKVYVSFDLLPFDEDDNKEDKQSKENVQRRILSSDSDVCLDWSDEDVALDKKEPDVFKDDSNEISDSDSVLTVIDECIQTPEKSFSDGSVLEATLAEHYETIDAVSESDTSPPKSMENIYDIKVCSVVLSPIKCKRSSNSAGTYTSKNEEGSISSAVEEIKPCTEMKLNACSFSNSDVHEINKQKATENLSKKSHTSNGIAQKDSRSVEDKKNVTSCMQTQNLMGESHLTLTSKDIILNNFDNQTIDGNNSELHIINTTKITNTQVIEINKIGEIDFENGKQEKTEEINVNTEKKEEIISDQNSAEENNNIEEVDENFTESMINKDMKATVLKNCQQNVELIEKKNDIAVKDEEITLRSFVKQVIESCISEIDFSQLKHKNVHCSKNICQAELIDEAGDRTFPDSVHCKLRGSSDAAETDAEIDPSYFGKNRYIYLDENVITGMIEPEIAKIEKEMNACDCQKKEKFVKQYEKNRHCLEDGNLSGSESVPDLEEVYQISPVCDCSVSATVQGQIDVKERKKLIHECNPSVTSSNENSSHTLQNCEGSKLIRDIDEESTSSTWAYPISEADNEGCLKANAILSQHEQAYKGREENAVENKNICIITNLSLFAKSADTTLNEEIHFCQGLPTDVNRDESEKNITCCRKERKSLITPKKIFDTTLSTNINDPGLSINTEDAKTEIDVFCEEIQEKCEESALEDALESDNCDVFIKNEFSLLDDRRQLKSCSAEDTNTGKENAIFAEVVDTIGRMKSENTTSANVTNCSNILEHSLLVDKNDASDIVIPKNKDNSVSMFSCLDEGSCAGSSSVLYSINNSAQTLQTFEARKLTGGLDINEESTSSTWAYPLSETDNDCFQRSDAFISQLKDEAVFHIKDTIDDGTDENAFHIETVAHTGRYSDNFQGVSNTELASDSNQFEQTQKQAELKAQSFQESIQNGNRNTDQPLTFGPALQNLYTDLPVQYFQRPWFPVSPHSFNMWPTVPMWQHFPGSHVLPYSHRHVPFEESLMAVNSRHINQQSSFSTFAWNQVPVYSSPNYSIGSRYYPPSMRSYFTRGRPRLEQPAPPQNAAQSAVSMAPWIISTDHMTPYMQDKNPDTYFVTDHFVDQTVDKSLTPQSDVETYSEECFPVLDIPVHEIPLPKSCSPKIINNPKTLKDLCSEVLNYPYAPVLSSLKLQNNDSSYSKINSVIENRKLVEFGSTVAGTENIEKTEIPEISPVLDSHDFDTTLKSVSNFSRQNKKPKQLKILCSLTLEKLNISKLSDENLQSNTYTSFEKKISFIPDNEGIKKADKQPGNCLIEISKNSGAENLQNIIDLGINSEEDKILRLETSTRYLHNKPSEMARVPVSATSDEEKQYTNAKTCFKDEYKGRTKVEKNVGERAENAEIFPVQNTPVFELVSKLSSPRRKHEPKLLKEMCSELLKSLRRSGNVSYKAFYKVYASCDKNDNVVEGNEQLEWEIKRSGHCSLRQIIDLENVINITVLAGKPQTSEQKDAVEKTVDLYGKLPGCKQNEATDKVDALNTEMRKENYTNEKVALERTLNDGSVGCKKRESPKSPVTHANLDSANVFLGVGHILNVIKQTSKITAPTKLKDKAIAKRKNTKLKSCQQSQIEKQKETKYVGDVNMAEKSETPSKDDMLNSEQKLFFETPSKNAVLENELKLFYSGIESSDVIENKNVNVENHHSVELRKKNEIKVSDKCSSIREAISDEQFTHETNPDIGDRVNEDISTKACLGSQKSSDKLKTPNIVNGISNVLSILQTTEENRGQIFLKETPNFVSSKLCQPKANQEFTADDICGDNLQKIDALESNMKARSIVRVSENCCYDKDRMIEDVLKTDDHQLYLKSKASKASERFTSENSQSTELIQKPENTSHYLKARNFVKESENFAIEITKVKEVLNKTDDLEATLKAKGIYRACKTTNREPVKIDIFLTDKVAKNQMLENDIRRGSVHHYTRIKNNSTNSGNSKDVCYYIKPVAKVVNESLFCRKRAGRSNDIDKASLGNKTYKERNKLQLKAMLQAKQVNCLKHLVARRDEESKNAYTKAWINQTREQMQMKQELNQSSKNKAIMNNSSKMHKSISGASLQTSYSESSQLSCSESSDSRSTRRSRSNVPKLYRFKTRTYRKHQPSSNSVNSSDASEHENGKQNKVGKKVTKCKYDQRTLPRTYRSMSSSSRSVSSSMEHRDLSEENKYPVRLRKRLKSGSKRIRSYSSSSERTSGGSRVRKSSSSRYRSVSSSEERQGTGFSRSHKKRSFTSSSSSEDGHRKSRHASNRNKSYSSLRSSEEKYRNEKSPDSSSLSSRGWHRRKKRSPSFSSGERHKTRISRSRERVRARNTNYWTDTSEENDYKRESRLSKYHMRTLGRFRNIFPAAPSYRTNSDLSTYSSTSSNTRYCNRTVSSSTGSPKCSHTGSYSRTVLSPKYENLTAAMESISMQYAGERSPQTDEHNQVVGNCSSQPLRCKKVLLKSCVLKKLKTAGLEKFLQALDGFSSERCTWLLTILVSDVMELEDHMQEAIKELENQHTNLNVITDVTGLDSYLVRELRNPDVVELFVIIETPDEEENIRSVIRYCCMKTFLDSHLTSSIEAELPQEHNLSL